MVEKNQEKRERNDNRYAREGTQREGRGSYQLKTRNRTRNDYESHSISHNFSPQSRVQSHRNMRIENIKERRTHAESKTRKVRKAGGKNVCAGMCDRARKENERAGVIGCEKGMSERMRVRGDESEKTREKSIVVHGDTHMYTAQTHGNTYRYIHATYMRHRDTQYYIYTTP